MAPKMVVAMTAKMRKMKFMSRQMMMLKVNFQIFVTSHFSTHVRHSRITEEDDDDSEFSEASEDVSGDESSDELGSDEESGKDWSDLEREAAEEDRERESGGIVVKSKSSSSHKHSSR